MSDNTTDNTNSYSTGELATLCGVSVRTVQYYDEKGLLPPSGLTEGGRRIYTDADAGKLRKILFLKSLGLKLADIRSFLESDVSTTVLRDILEEQDAKLASELEERAAARTRIAAMIAELDRTGELPAEPAADMEDIMQKKSWRESELKPLYMKMLAVGIPLAIVEIATIVWWVMTGNWVPFVVYLLLAVIVCVPLVRMYRRQTAYVCPHCRKVFVPKTVEWFFAMHTPTTRKVTCTHCGTKEWCAEVSRDRLVAS